MRVPGLLSLWLAFVTAPLGAAEYYVDPVNGVNAPAGGTQSAPWKTVAYAVNRIVALPPASQAGLVLNLRANALYPTAWFPATLHGTASQPMVIQPYDGDRVVFDAGEERFRQPGAWEPVPGWPGEWRTKDPPFVTAPRDPVSNGQMTDSRLRLIKYGAIEDLRATNESYHVVPLSDPREGFTLLANPTHKLPFMYMGPGVHYVFENPEKTVGRVHIRLSHTHFDAPGIEDYAGPTDPNALALSIARKNAVAATVGAQNLIFRNVVFQNGGDVTLSVNQNAANVTFDHCEVYGARRGAGVSGSQIRFHHCTFDGGLAPWTTRSDVKNEYEYPFVEGCPSPTKNDASCVNNLGANTHDILVTHYASGSEYVHCTFRRAHDGIQLRGDDNEIRDSLFEDLNDEAIRLLKLRDGDDNAIPTLANLRIHGNVFRQVLQVLSFFDNPIGGPVYFYRNVVDQRVPTRGFRTLPPDAPAPWIWRYGSDFKDTATLPLYAYQNTFFSSHDVDKGSYMSHLFYGDPPAAPTFLNNISLGLNVDRPVSRVPSAGVGAVSNGNVWYRYDVFPDPLSPRPLWVHGPQGYFSLDELWAVFPAWESQSKYADPQLANFTDEYFEHQTFYPNTDFRPLAGGPAHGGGVALPAGLPDDFTSGGAPDVGARPVGAPAMAVGVDAATLFPAPGVPVALAGQDQTIVDANGDGFEIANLDGAGSSDPDGAVAAHAWSIGGRHVIDGAQVPLDLPEGDHYVRLVVTDDAGKADSDAVRIRVLPAVAGENRLSCPGFEEGTCGWEGTEGTLTPSKLAHSGRRALQLSEGILAQTVTQRVPISLGTYTVSGWVATESLTPGGATLSYRVLDFEGAVMASGTFATRGKTSPYRYHQAVIAPIKGAASLEVVGTVSGSGAGFALFDDLRVRDRNLLRNGRFEVRAANGQEDEAPGWGFVRGGVVIDDPENVRSGRHALALVPGDTYHLITQDAAHTSPSGYRVSAWVKTAGLSVPPTLVVKLLGASGQTLATRAVAVTLSEGDYAYVSRALLPADIPAGTASLSVEIELPQLTDGSAFIDDVMVEPLP